MKHECLIRRDGDYCQCTYNLYTQHGFNVQYINHIDHDLIVLLIQKITPNYMTATPIWNQIIESDLAIEIQNEEANIITLSYISVNDYFAKQFTETLIDEMIKMYITHQTKQARNTLDFLQDRADSVFVELEKAEQEFARIKDINQRIIKASGRLKELQLMREVEVLNTMYLEIVKNLEISKMTLLNKTPIINIIDKPILPLEEEKISKAAGILGGFLGGFLAVCFFVFRKLFRDALEEN